VGDLAALDELLDVLDLSTGDAVGDVCHFRAGNVGGGDAAGLRGAPSGGVVFGGQLLAQAVVAAARMVPDKVVLSLNMVFSRGAAPAWPLDVEAESHHRGRAFASVTVAMNQHDRPCCRGLALMHEPGEDLIRHADRMPDVPWPDDLPPRPLSGQPFELRIVDDVDLSDPDAVGPPELRVWCRFPGAPDDLVISQALLAYASDGFLIGTAMRPHAGVGQSMAHKTVSTTVLGQCLSFHEPFEASRWMLLDQRSEYAGRGRASGRAGVFTEDGRLVATFHQNSMIRDFPVGMAPPPGYRSDH
jgi:acyl-CoA thioesterase II